MFFNPGAFGDCSLADAATSLASELDGGPVRDDEIVGRLTHMVVAEDAGDLKAARRHLTFVRRKSLSRFGITPAKSVPLIPDAVGIRLARNAETAGRARDAAKDQVAASQPRPYAPQTSEMAYGGRPAVTRARSIVSDAVPVGGLADLDAAVYGTRRRRVTTRSIAQHTGTFTIQEIAAARGLTIADPEKHEPLEEELDPWDVPGPVPGQRCRRCHQEAKVDARLGLCSGCLLKHSANPPPTRAYARYETSLTQPRLVHPADAWERVRVARDENLMRAEAKRRLDAARRRNGARPDAGVRLAYAPWVPPRTPRDRHPWQRRPWQETRIGTPTRGSLRGLNAQRVRLAWWDGAARKGKAAKPYGRLTDVELPCLVCLARLTPQTVKRRRRTDEDQVCANCEREWRKAAQPWGDEYTLFRDRRRVLRLSETAPSVAAVLERARHRLDLADLGPLTRGTTAVSFGIGDNGISDGTRVEVLSSSLIRRAS
jgi:hypothetical protein